MPNKKQVVAMLVILLAALPLVALGSLPEGRIEKAAAGDQFAATDSLFRSAFAAQQAGNLTEAIGLYESLLAETPDHSQATFNLAHAYLNDGDPTTLMRSAELFERVLELDPQYTEALYHLASAHWQSGHEAAARKYDELYLERASEPSTRLVVEARLASGVTHGPTVDELFAQAFAAQRAGDRDRAKRLYETVIAQAPAHGQAHFNLGYSYLQGSTSEDWNRSVELFERVREIDADYAAALFNIASAYWKLGDAEMARRHDAEFLRHPQAHPSLRQVSEDRLAKGE